MANPAEVLAKPWVYEFLTSQPPLIARLATCSPKTLQPHVVPVWYDWDGERLWISAFVSTRKVREALQNPLVSVVMDTDAPGQPARGVILEGRVEIIQDPALVAPWATRIYTRYVGPEGIKGADLQSWIVDPENRILMLKPERAYAWGS